MGEFDFGDGIPFNPDEFITANDGRDKIDQQRLRTIESSKRNTQRGITEYTAYVLHVDKNTSDTFLLTDMYGKAMQIFGGISAQENPEGNVGVAIAYIVGPSNKRLPHDHLTPPCALPQQDISINNLDLETRKVFNKLRYACSFVIPNNVGDVSVGSTVQVSFAKGPSEGSFKGGYVTRVLNGAKNLEASTLFKNKCKGMSISSAGNYAGGVTLTDGKTIIQDAGYPLSLKGGYPGSCRGCAEGCDQQISLDLAKVGPPPSKTSGNDPRALFTMLVAPFMPSGAVVTSGLRSARDQQRILLKEVNRLSSVSSFTESERAELAAAYVKAKKIQDEGQNPSQELFNTYNKIRKKYKGSGIKILLIGRPKTQGSGHQNVNDYSLAFAVDYSGARLDCIIEALNMAGPLISNVTPITRVLREAANNAVHVEFKATNRELAKLAAEDPAKAQERVKELLQSNQAEALAQTTPPEPTSDASPEEVATTSGIATNVNEQISS